MTIIEKKTVFSQTLCASTWIERPLIRLSFDGSIKGRFGATGLVFPFWLYLKNPLMSFLTEKKVSYISDLSWQIDKNQIKTR